MSVLEDPLVKLAHRNYRIALAVAKSAWPEGTENSVLQAAAATVLIHLTELRRSQAGQTRASANARPAPASALAAAPNLLQCPKCGGPAWDNRKNKKFPAAPDFKCKNTLCVNEKGQVTGWWVPKAKPAPARHPVGAATRESFEDFPEALDELDNDMPF